MVRKKLKIMKRVVIITGPGFEDPEIIAPFYRLQEVADVEIVTNKDQVVIGKHGYSLSPTIKIKDLDIKKFDAVIIPGGNEAPDRVRQVSKIVKFVRDMYNAGKLISSTCHGPWVLIEAGIVKGKKATCYPGMKTDLINAGAVYLKQPVVVDGNLVTSDHPRSITLWMKSTIDLLNKKK